MGDFATTEVEREDRRGGATTILATVAEAVMEEVTTSMTGGGGGNSVSDLRLGGDIGSCKISRTVVNRERRRERLADKGQQ